MQSHPLIFCITFCISIGLIFFPLNPQYTFRSVPHTTISIKAKDFAAEMTSVNVQQKDLHGQEQITREHVDNNAAVRNMLLQRGIVPEQLPPGEDVKKVERRLKSEEKSLTKKQGTNKTSKKGKE